jgi:hypothetical protein
MLCEAQDVNGEPLHRNDLCWFAFGRGIVKQGIVKNIQPVNGELMVALQSTKSEDILFIEPSGVFKVPSASEGLPA